MNTPTEHGVLYVAYGQRHLAEAIHSCGSLRRVHAEIPVHLVTSAEDLATRGDELHAHFGSCSVHPDIRRTFRDKIIGMQMSPFPRTLYLDSDTELLGRVDDVFDILGKFEFAYCRDTVRYAMPAPEVPPIFSEPNGGVLAYRRCPAVEALLTRWLQINDSEEAAYKKAHGPRSVYVDQGALRIALYESDVRQYVFGSEYNLRAYALWYAGARVRILHAREPYLTKYRHSINNNEDMRYGDGESWPVRQVIKLKIWIKENLFGRSRNWRDKERLSKQYPT
ncbi:MAG: hypothetical protein IAE77_09720 [Prosthecobacter sp.]|jgi:hypothetical protein|uniref:hypothetical protein n=1 Tax=Prosthecobacter sp. TaxID=1965333 RepID=UPI0019E441CC|nr:hypothetical protein [Prosthecobacter sp.]MBE2283720.1 hypothetical protein [Prosthecobacter sp.]